MRNNKIAFYIRQKHKIGIVVEYLRIYQVHAVRVLFIKTINPTKLRDFASVLFERHDKLFTPT